ncbi:MAG TPA: hypothetical protein VG248_06220 [Caulobacteraceae bacterium]|jgi:hypothetical protein|nr:hypothetical protein [Caulobacteraceae bacterium]
MSDIVDVAPAAVAAPAISAAPVSAVSGAPAPPAVSAVSWGAVFAGAIVALAVSLICAALGAGFSADSLSPWPNTGLGLKSFTVLTGVWIVITQWLSSGAGGYVTGRLRIRWHGYHTHEVFFRDTANGLVMWSLATVTVAGVSAIVGGTAALAIAMQISAASDAGQSAAVDTVRKAAAAYWVFTAISMIVGAFIACVAAAIGGQQRDEHP